MSMESARDLLAALPRRRKTHKMTMRVYKPGEARATDECVARVEVTEGSWLPDDTGMRYPDCECPRCCGGLQ